MTCLRRAVAFLTLLVLSLNSEVESQEDELFKRDGEALEALLRIVLPNSNYTADTLPCAWNANRVTCKDKRISGLNLSDFQLVGSIPPRTLSNLSALTFLNLSSNHLTEPLPDDLSQLVNLQTLDLSGNNYTGSYPEFIGKLEKLQHLNLSSNLFEGSVLEGIELKNLRILDLSRNDFTGNLSRLFNASTRLEHVELSHNRFHGDLPQEISRLGELRRLHVRANDLSGGIPDLVEKGDSLLSLDLSVNRFNGSLPDSLDKLRSLEVLNLASNFFGGQVPPSIFQIQNLKILNLSGNDFTLDLVVKNNSALSFLEIHLESNRLTGKIPAALLQLPSIITLKLGNNSFSEFASDIPTDFPMSLQELDVNGNGISGALPLISSGGLLTVNFSSNNFTGVLKDIPSGLKVLDVHNNKLEGTVPEMAHTLEYLDLSSNVFQGDFPTNLGILVNLRTLSLAGNNFSSHAFPLLRDLRHLELLNFSRTNLNGNISRAIRVLKELRYLDLSQNNLSGVIPSDMSNLVNLVSLDLSDNQLQGSIPEEFSRLINLQSLDLRNNNLTGKIPDSSQWQSFTNQSFSGNRGLCGVQLGISCEAEKLTFLSSEKGLSRRAALGIGLGVGFSFLLIILTCLSVWCRNSMAVKPLFKDDSTTRQVASPVFPDKDSEVWAKAVRDPHSYPVFLLEKPLVSLTFADLLQATVNFSKDLLIADGSYGPTYRGVLPDGTELAIKVLVEVSFNDGRDPVNRIHELASIKHPNLVALTGYCFVGDESLLIYEYMVNGDLQRLLHDLPEGTPNPEDWSSDTWEHMEGDEFSGDFVSWPARLNIAIGIARALAFLHHNCSPPVVHGDVKSSNILLDDMLEAHLADSGLAQFLNSSSHERRGSVGYLPPEPDPITIRGDVYSFGIVLLELVTGRKPTGHYLNDSYGGTLVGWVRLLMKEKRGQKALDPKLARNGDVTQMLEVLRVGYLCTAESPEKRPSMQQVLGLLKEGQPEGSSP